MPAEIAPERPWRRTVLLMASGMVSGAGLRCLGLAVDWLFMNGRPVWLEPDAEGNLSLQRMVTGLPYALLLARQLGDAALAGMWGGLVGGGILALLSRAWPGAATVGGAVLFWGITGALPTLLMFGLDLLDQWQRPHAKADLVRGLLLGTTFGAVFGVMTAVLARRLDRLLGGRTPVAPDPSSPP